MRSLLLILCFSLSASAHAQETKTSMGFALSPNFSTIRYTNTGDVTQENFDLMKSATSGSLGLSGNVFFQYKVTDKFYITWGLGIQNYRYQWNYSEPPQNEIPTMGLNLKHSQHYIQLNVSAKYRIYKTVYVRAGIGADLLAEDKAKLYLTCSDCEETYVGSGDSNNFKEAMLPVSVGVGYELKLTERLNIMAELFGATSLTNALEETPGAQLEQRPLQLGFSLGIIRSF